MTELHINFRPEIGLYVRVWIKIWICALQYLTVYSILYNNDFLFRKSIRELYLVCWSINKYAVLCALQVVIFIDESRVYCICVLVFSKYFNIFYFYFYFFDVGIKLLKYLLLEIAPRIATHDRQQRLVNI